MVIIGILLIGIITGLILNKAKFEKYIDIIVNISIYFLLFFLGISVGTNEKILNNLLDIGLISFMLTFFAILGSCIMAYFIYNWFYKDNEK